MYAVRMLVTIMAVALLIGIGACKKKGGGDSKDKQADPMAAASDMAGADMAASKMAGADMAASDMAGSDKPKLSAADNPKVGDSCKGLSASDGRTACDGNIRMFCSSYSKYKWKKLGECKDGKKCVSSADGKSVSCK